MVLSERSLVCVSFHMSSVLSLRAQQSTDDDSHKEKRRLQVSSYGFEGIPSSDKIIRSQGVWKG